MFVIDATPGLDQALQRLARLMYNIERGARVFEWAPGSADVADPAPKPDFLSISVPGITKAAPPSTVSIRPSVAFVYHAPGLDLPEVVRQVRGHLEAYTEDHLR